MANTGVGATLVLSGASTFSGRWKSISGFRQTVDTLDDTALSSNDYYEFVPDDLAKVDAITVELYADLDVTPPVIGAVPTVTIEFPLQSGQSVKAVLTGTAIITEFSQPELAIGQRMMSTLGLQFDGKSGPTFAKAS